MDELVSDGVRNHRTHYLRHCLRLLQPDAGAGDGQRGQEMMKRRAFLSVATGSLLLAGSERASAQAFKPPQPEDLLILLRTPALIEKILLGTSALRTLLLFERSRIEKDEKGDIWHRDEAKFFALLGQLRDPVAQATVMKQLESKDARTYSNNL